MRLIEGNYYYLTNENTLYKLTENYRHGMSLFRSQIETKDMSIVLFDMTAFKYIQTNVQYMMDLENNGRIREATKIDKSKFFIDKHFKHIVG
jgi:hypothetical protein